MSKPAVPPGSPPSLEDAIAKGDPPVRVSHETPPGFAPPPAVAEPTEAQKEAAIAALRSSMRRAVHAAPPEKVCFLLEGKRVQVGDELLAALTTVGTLLLAQCRAADPIEKPDAPTNWAWMRIHLNDATKGAFIDIETGAAKDAPGDGLPAVAVLTGR